MADIPEQTRAKDFIVNQPNLQFWLLADIDVAADLLKAAEAAWGRAPSLALSLPRHASCLGLGDSQSRFQTCGVEAMGIAVSAEHAGDGHAHPNHAGHRSHYGHGAVHVVQHGKGVHGAHVPHEHGDDGCDNVGGDWVSSLQVFCFIQRKA